MLFMLDGGGLWVDSGVYGRAVELLVYRYSGYNNNVLKSGLTANNKIDNNILTIKLSSFPYPLHNFSLLNYNK